MFLNKIKLLNFLKLNLPAYSFISESKGLWQHSALFQNNDRKTVFFISGLYKNASLQELLELSKSWGTTIWITPDSFFYRKSFLTLQPLYFIKKEKNSFTLYDRRFLKLKKNLYPLPPKKITLEYFIKSPSLKEKEDLFLFPKRTSSLYCKGDSTDHLNNSNHLKSLENRLNKKTSPSKLNDKIYLLLKSFLDK